MSPVSTHSFGAGSVGLSPGGGVVSRGAERVPETANAARGTLADEDDPGT